MGYTVSWILLRTAESRNPDIGEGHLAPLQTGTVSKQRHQSGLFQAILKESRSVEIVDLPRSQSFESVELLDVAQVTRNRLVEVVPISQTMSS